MCAAGVNTRAGDSDIDPDDYQDDEDELDDDEDEEDEEEDDDDDENGPKWYVGRWCRECTQSHPGA